MGIEGGDFHQNKQRKYFLHQNVAAEFRKRTKIEAHIYTVLSKSDEPKSDAFLKFSRNSEKI